MAHLFLMYCLGCGCENVFFLQCWSAVMHYLGCTCTYLFKVFLVYHAVLLGISRSCETLLYCSFILFYNGDLDTK